MKPPMFLATVLAALALGLGTTVGVVAQPGSADPVWHDAEPLIGKVGGQYRDDPPNRTFRLVVVPQPYASLMLFSDGRYLVQGIDYTLDHEGYVDIAAGDAPRKTLIAHYRSSH